MEKLGLEVTKVVVLVDREEKNGKQNIEQHCPDVEVLIERSEVMALYKEREAHRT